MITNSHPTFENGKICYLEIPANDIQLSARFYEKVFNWKIRNDTDGNFSFDDAVGEVSGMWILGRKPSANTVLVQVSKTSHIYVPTAFTPNKDGLNDFLKPIMFSIKELKYFRIFNRWGEIFFETKGGNNIQGWDGKINGLNQNSANFVWIAEAVTEGNQLLNLKGSFILIR